MKKLTVILRTEERKLLRDLLLQAALDGNEVNWTSTKAEAVTSRFLLKKLELLP